MISCVTLLDTSADTSADTVAGTSANRLSGIADEACASIENQISCHTALGWQHMELRSVDGAPLAQLSEPQLSHVCTALRAADFAVPVIDSQIGNWHARIDQPFAKDLAELEKLAELAKVLGSSMIRVMSYPNAQLSDSAWSGEAVARLRALSALAARHDLMLIHENCAGWGGQSATHTLRLLREVGHDNFQLLFDLGNGLSYGYDAIEFLRQTWPWVAHVHLKDGCGSGRHVSYTFPGEGDVRVQDCLQFLHDHGYRGGYAIEPHLNLIPHLQQQYGAATGGARLMQSNYMQYAKEAQAMLDAAGAASAGTSARGVLRREQEYAV